MLLQGLAAFMQNHGHSSFMSGMSPQKVRHGLRCRSSPLRPLHLATKGSGLLTGPTLPKSRRGCRSTVEASKPERMFYFCKPIQIQVGVQLQTTMGVTHYYVLDGKHDSHQVQVDMEKSISTPMPGDRLHQTCRLDQHRRLHSSVLLALKT